MSVMLEVFYAAPSDQHLESDVAGIAAHHSGGVTCRDEPTDEDVSQAVILTIEFDDWDDAEQATSALREAGYHVEGPMTYGDD